MTATAKTLATKVTKNGSGASLVNGYDTDSKRLTKRLRLSGFVVSGGHKGKKRRGNSDLGFGIKVVVVAS